MGQQDVSDDDYQKMTRAERDAYHDKRRFAQNDRDRKRLLKIPMFLVREIVGKDGKIDFLLIKRHVNKSNAALVTIHQELSSYWQSHRANYQAPGVKGKYVGFYFEKGFDYHEYPRTIMEDLFLYATGDLKALEARYGGRFDQNRFKWEL